MRTTCKSNLFVSIDNASDIEIRCPRCNEVIVPGEYHSNSPLSPKEA